MDGWGTSDIKWLPDAAFWWIAAILKSVEGGAAWPEQWLDGRAAYLHKNPEGGGDPPRLQSAFYFVGLPAALGKVQIGVSGGVD